MLDSLQHVVDRHLWRISWLSAFSEHSGADQDRVPVGVGLSRLVKLIGAPNVGLWGITDKVDSVQGFVDAVCVFAPLLQKSGGKVERAQLRLSKGDGLHVLARDGSKHGLERSSQGTHSNSRVAMGCCPHDIIVGEENRRAFLECFGTGAQPAILAHAQVEDDLRVTCPVSAIGEDKDGLNVHQTVVALLGVL